MNSNIIWVVIVLFLFTVIGVLGWIIMEEPATIQTPTVATSTPAPAPSPATATPEPILTEPLSARVSITQPVSGAEVGGSFTVSGKAPGNWYFEASFPIQVRDGEGNVIARTHATAQSDWMTTELVAFTATVHIDGGYKGPADLILLRDNPSGLPEHDDSTTIPIIIK
jgi:hypothetical protein